MNIAVITAKGGNTTLENKNLIKINNKSFIEYQAIAARESKYVDKLYISTEDTMIKDEAKLLKIPIIDRPNELSQSDTNHGDVIEHIVNFLSKKYKSIDTITILLGNTVMVTGIDIDNCISCVLSDTEIDSSMTVWKAQDDHPLRAMKINNQGFLESYLDVGTVDTNRQSYENIYYYDQGPWTFKMESFLKYKKLRKGPGPWWWMAKKCKPIVRYWVTGRDTHELMDVKISEFWINQVKNQF